jgi:hypothetical protein
MSLLGRLVDAWRDVVRTFGATGPAYPGTDARYPPRSRSIVMGRTDVATRVMSGSESREQVTAHFHEGSLELRCAESPDEWILSHDPVSVER